MHHITSECKIQNLGLIFITKEKKDQPMKHLKTSAQECEIQKGEKRPTAKSQNIRNEKIKFRSNFHN